MTISFLSENNDEEDSMFIQEDDDTLAISLSSKGLNKPRLIISHPSKTDVKTAMKGGIITFESAKEDLDINIENTTLKIQSIDVENVKIKATNNVSVDIAEGKIENLDILSNGDAHVNIMATVDELEYEAHGSTVLHFAKLEAEAEFQLNGQTTLTIDAINVEDLELSAHGNTTANIAGNIIEKLELSLHGNGQININSKVEEGKVSINGDGNVYIKEAGRLTHDIKGAGKLEYNGNVVMQDKSTTIKTSESMSDHGQFDNSLESQVDKSNATN